MREKLNRFIKIIVWTGAIVALCYAGYVAYDRWWGTSALQTSVKNAEKKIGEVLGSAKESVTTMFSNVARKTAGDAIISAGESIRSYGENVGRDAVAPQALSATTTVNGYVPLAIVAKVGETLSFVLNSDAVYFVDWGDGKKESGNTTNGKEIGVSHAWGRAGTYLMVTTVRQGDKTLEESFSVKIKR